jgi:hypothetical protein
MRTKINSTNVRFAICPHCGYIREGYLTWKNRPASDSDYRAAPPTPLVTVCGVCQPRVETAPNSYQELQTDYPKYNDVDHTYDTYLGVKIDRPGGL